MSRTRDSGPSDTSVAVTPSDTAAQPVGRGLYVGTSGNITGRLAGDSADQVFKNIAQGVEHGLVFQYIRSSGTTAADMLILF